MARLPTYGYVALVQTFSAEDGQAIEFTAPPGFQMHMAIPLPPKASGVERVLMIYQKVNISELIPGLGG